MCLCVCARACVCVCVCMCVYERETHTDRQADCQRGRQTHGQTGMFVGRKPVTERDVCIGKLYLSGRARATERMCVGWMCVDACSGICSDVRLTVSTCLSMCS